MAELKSVDLCSGNSDRKVSSFEGLFYVILLVASGLSAYQTFNGFSYDLPWHLAFVVAFIVFLGLIMSNFKIKEAYIKNDSINKPLMMFGVFLVISLISNTNAFYSFFLKKDIVNQTQKNAFNDFEKGNEILLQELGKTESMREYFEKKRQLDIEVANLKRQIVDRNNPGMGEKSLEHLNAIESILNERVTRLNAPQDFNRLQMYADEMEDMIYRQFKNSLSSDTRAIYELQNKIEKSIKSHKDKILTEAWSKKETDSMDYDLKSFEKESEKLIGKNIELPIINTSADEIGSLTYTLNNFFHGINLPSIILSVFISLILDMIPLMISLSLFKKEEE